MFKLLANIFAVNFIYKDYEKTFKEIFEDEKTFERSLNHTNSVYNLNHIFGKEDEKDIPNYEIKRTKEWYSNIELNNIEEETIDPFEEKKISNMKFLKIIHLKIYHTKIFIHQE